MDAALGRIKPTDFAKKHLMPIIFEKGSAISELGVHDIQEAINAALDATKSSNKVLALPPDFTRYESRAGQITSQLYEMIGDRLTDIMPALGTHFPMSDAHLEKMFPGVPKSLFREHKWRTDVETLGEVPGEFVEEVTEGIYDKPWTAQVNKLLTSGDHDMILSIGQVVPHEVIGMANYNKNIFVGTGGAEAINVSHYISAVYGMERIMGRADNPLRKILNYAQDNFCQDLPLVYILTVVGINEDDETVLRGIFVGTDHDCFWRASELAAEVNITRLDEAPNKVICWLDEEEFGSTWIGNKAIYRSRMAIADKGELIILGPGVHTFGEDEAIDGLIRKYGYRTTQEIMKYIKNNSDIRNNLSAAAHLIHGSSEGRFRIIWCPGKISQKDIEYVGYNFGDWREQAAKYKVNEISDGWNETSEGERFYFIKRPALGLWADQERLQ